ncbi:MAG TPA: thrombospondin type 3 repeat-containing protein [Polyangiaceae bacterium]|nr:thrombospondin type 3 repeat-containing protein [Polyangiaceae bacterium]
MRQGSTATRLHASSRLVLALSLAMASLCASVRAHAEATFPSKLEALAATSCTPTCLLCHTDPAGGLDHLRNDASGAPWALINFTFLKNGGTVDNVTPLDAKDTDGDGMSDLKEIQAGRDPLVKGEAPICSELKYGCGASHLARTAPLDRGSYAWLGAAAVACVLAGRRRVQSRRR